MRPALWMAATLAVGIAAAEWLRPHPLLALGAVLACAAWAALDRGARRSTVALLATVACLGALRYAYAQTAGHGSLGAWEGLKVTLTGTVVTEPELKKPAGLAYTVAVEQVNQVTAGGKVYVTQKGGKAPGFGELVSFSGTLKPPLGPRTPGGFDRAAYLGRQGVYLETTVSAVQANGPGALNPVRKAAVAARLKLEGVLKKTLPPKEAALMAGLLFGSRSELPDDIKEAFKTSGVFHLLAVSGGNIAMIVMPFLALLGWCGLSKRRAAALAIPLVIFFVFLTGASPSVMRAGLMAVLVLAGDLLRRERNALNTLGAAIMLLLLWAPGLLFDLGLQLSAVATLGILLFARPIERWLAPRLQWAFGERAGGWLAAGLSVTLAAQVLVEPISLHNFGAFSTVAPLANLLVLVFLEPVVNIASVSVLVGLVLLPLAWLLNWVVRAGLWLLVFVVKATSAVPGAFLELGEMPAVLVLTWYAAVAVLAAPTLRDALIARAGLARGWWRRSSRQTRKAALTSLFLVLATGWTWRLALADPLDTLYVTFLDVGQGDAILVRAPGGRTMLVDTGPASPPDPAKGRTGFDAGEEVVVPYAVRAGVTRLDYLVLTHPDQDHAGGMAAVLNSLPVGALLEPQFPHGSQGYRDGLAAAAAKGVAVWRPTAGETFRLGRHVTAEVLHPAAAFLTGTRSDQNSNSVVLRLRYRNISLLLAGDMEAVTEERLLDQGTSVKADVLKVAHHGSEYSTTAPFLQAVQPRWAVISAGAGNLFGHPHRDTLRRLEGHGAAVYRTDRHGSVTVKTDGYSLTFTTTRGQPGDEKYRPLGLLGRRWIAAW